MGARGRDAASRRARRPLTPGDVVAAGVELVDDVGLAGFTTRALADRLGTYPAARPSIHISTAASKEASSGRSAPPCQRRASTESAGLRLHADDIDWSWGRGPEVTGPAEAILMAVAGRPADTEHIGLGHGLALLRCSNSLSAMPMVTRAN